MNNMILGAHALADNKFAIAVGALEDDDPLSALLIYDETFEGLWGFVEIPRILMSVTSVPSETRDGKPTYVAMSDEGDAYFIEGDVAVEKMPGSGVRSDDAEGLGPMNTIIAVDDRLYASGLGSQVYHRPRGGPWHRIAERMRDGLENCYLNAVSVRSGAMAVCGHTRVAHRDPTPEERREMDAARAAGEMERYHRLFRKYCPVIAPAAGCFYIRQDVLWERIELPTNAHMNDLCVALKGGFLCVGDSGIMVQCDDPQEPQDVSHPDIKDRLLAVRQSGDSYFVVGKAGIYRFSSQFELIEQIDLPDGMGTPNCLEVVGDTIWYFDFRGVARRRDGDWQIIDIPPDLWALQFE